MVYDGVLMHAIVSRITSLCLTLLCSISSGVTLFSPPVFAQFAQQQKFACNPNSSQLLLHPGRTDLKYNPSSLYTYNRGIVYSSCTRGGVGETSKVDCISKVLYILQRDGSYAKYKAFGGRSPAQLMCTKFF